MSTAHIISNSGLVRQFDRVKLYDFGMDLERMKLAKQPKPDHLKKTKRGKITKFSTASARRLRETLLTKYVPDCDVYGVTLTLPLEHGEWENSTEYWGGFWNNYTNKLRQSLPDVGIVWRIELQKRNAPHIHAIVYTPKDKPFGKMVTYWLESCDALAQRLGVAIKTFDYCFKVSQLVGDRIGFYRYLVDHASKHKQEQLGYQGRQWGVINAKLFKTKESSEILRFDDEGHRIRFIRAFGRFNRLPVCKFIDGKRVVLKYRRSYRSFGMSAVRGGADTIRRLWENARRPVNAPTSQQIKD